MLLHSPSYWVIITPNRGLKIEGPFGRGLFANQGLISIWESWRQTTVIPNCGELNTPSISVGVWYHTRAKFFQGKSLEFRIFRGSSLQGDPFLEWASRIGLRAFDPWIWGRDLWDFRHAMIPCIKNSSLKDLDLAKRASSPVILIISAQYLRAVTWVLTVYWMTKSHLRSLGLTLVSAANLVKNGHSRPRSCRLVWKWPKMFCRAQ